MYNGKTNSITPLINVVKTNINHASGNGNHTTSIYMVIWGDG